MSHDALVVDFAVMQIYSPINDDIHIARIDCCHGTCHRHLFDTEGVDLFKQAGSSRVIEPIPEEGSWQAVDRLYSESIDRFMAGWEENLRRWERQE